MIYEDDHNYSCCPSDPCLIYLVDVLCKTLGSVYKMTDEAYPNTNKPCRPEGRFTNKFFSAT